MKKFNKYIKILLTISLVVFLNQACTDLDEELYDTVTQDQFFQNDETFIATLGPAYTNMYDYADEGYFSVSEVSTDEMIVPTRGSDWDDGGHWRRLHLHSWNYEDGQIGGAWSFSFGGVNECNRILDTFDQLVEEGKVPQENAESFVAELKVLRAFYYFVLLDVYGNVPIVTEFIEAPEFPETNSRKEVFDFIAAELEENVPLLPPDVSAETYGRMNRWAGRALEARLHLNAEAFIGEAHWDEVIEATNAIINSGEYALEDNYFTNFNVNSETSSEFIWAIPFDQVKAQGFQMWVRSLHYGSQNTYNFTEQPWNGFCTLEEFYNSYDENDLRRGDQGTQDGPAEQRGNFIAGYQYKSDGTPVEDSGVEDEDPDGEWVNFTPHVNAVGPNALRQDGARIGKWEYEMGATQHMSNDYGVFRYADVLLMKAEAIWRNTNDPTNGEALALVNQIRARAGVDDLTTLDGPISFAPEDGIVPGGELLNERGREMFAENTRRQDLLRWDVFFDVEKWTPPINNPGDEINSAEHTKLFPIPRGQLDANKNLKQNNGYQTSGGG